MNYQELKSQNFAKYCAEGKLNLVKKWINNPNVDINWNFHNAVRNAVRYNQLDVLKLLIDSGKLKTDYENETRKLKGAAQDANGRYVSGVLNPFTMAIIKKNFEILDIFTKTYVSHFKINTNDNLEIISDMNDDEINNYFMKIPNFIEYVVISEFDNIIPEDLKIIFFLR